MAAQLREVRVITERQEEASFENTVVALERSGELLDRAMAVFFNLIASNTNDVMQQFESELAPQLTAHEDAILLDSKLCSRGSVRCTKDATRWIWIRRPCSCWSAITPSSCAPAPA
ncbi:MAG: hypothetical protein WDM77_17670 [Steroidobacteraceae bacterium]